VPIDHLKVAGARLPDARSSWDEDQVILYHLGVGAGDPPTSPGELSYCYEANLQVLPTFATIPPFVAMLNVGSLEGLDVSLAMILHGEHEIELHRPLPVRGSAEHHSRVGGLHDKGKGALLVVETVSSDQDGPLFTNRASLFLRGEGGFGGGEGPAPVPPPPEESPDLVVESPTLPQQALLYRLSGDKNPLHADPAFAALGGFERPILHGLCSYGMACKAVADNVLAGRHLSRYRARFSGVVYPGETLVTSIWDRGPEVIVGTATRERGALVLHGVFHVVDRLGR
jgi:acyl dehydratase